MNFDFLTGQILLGDQGTGFADFLILNGPVLREEVNPQRRISLAMGVSSGGWDQNHTAVPVIGCKVKLCSRKDDLGSQLRDTRCFVRSTAGPGRGFGLE